REIEVLAWLGHPVDQAELKRLLGAETLAKQHKLLRLGQTDRQRKQARDAARDAEAYADLGKAELRVAARDDEITAQGELTPGAERVAVHRGADREWCLPDQPGHILDAVQPPRVFCLADRIVFLAQVVTGAERPSRPCEHAGADVVTPGPA